MHWPRPRTAFADENAIFLQADVTDEDEVADVFDQMVDRLGLIGGLVNSAGMLATLPAEETTAELLREMLDVNLVGSFISAKAALERMGAIAVDRQHRLGFRTARQSRPASPMALRRPASS